ncbi:cupin domain-containing protein [Sulfuricurvum sp.]|uniref:cupin domain-containing protein n=1 Tax=Sulfuricurvum sp. TaxID=2025608 RepID=UPI00261F2686|nr:cupin domain-containing protein [Sulfuricurvum sp.]MDD3595116.1 cupin domain-containing protein [Sulfuricurvum sp.]
MNIYQISNPKEGEESFFTLYQTSTIKIEAIRSKLSAPGEMYDQKEDEWVVLVRGNALLEVEGEEIPLSAGDSLHLKQRVRHRVLATSDDALWLAVFSS